MSKERIKPTKYCLLVTRLNKVRCTTYDCLTASELTPELRKELWHAEKVLQNGVELLERWIDADESDR